MKDGIRQATEMAPFRNPATMPTAMATNTAYWSGQCHCSMAMPAQAAARAITEPTERSMPPMMRT